MELQQPHKYSSILEQENKERLAKKDQEIYLCELKFNNLKINFESLRKRSNEGELSEVDRERMIGFFQDMGEWTRRLHTLDKERKRLADEDMRYQKGSAQVYEGTNLVQQKTGKNRLYVGNRQFVAEYASKDPNKKKRTLDIGIWSWGLNFAWIEGGIDAGVEVKIKLNESYPPHPYESLPEDALYRILAKPTMNGDTWLALCKDFPGSILWVNYANENRPSWTALEIKACLDAGYQFVQYQHKKKGGQALKLVKRDKSSKSSNDKKY